LKNRFQAVILGLISDQPANRCVKLRRQVCHNFTAEPWW